MVEEVKEDNSSCSSSSSSSEDETADDKEKKAKKKKKKKKKIKTVKAAIDLFYDNVGIAGLLETHKSKTSFERNIWRLIVLLLFAYTIYNSYQTIQAYLIAPTLFARSLINQQAPFPDVSICSPHTIDQKKLRNLLVIKEEKMAKIVEQRSIDTYDFITQLILLRNGPQILLEELKIDNPNLVQIGTDILNDTLKSMGAGAGYPELISKITPSCEESLTNCQWYGHAFECCKSVEFIMAEHGHCYYFNLTNRQALGDSQLVSMTGLSFTFSIDSNSLRVSDEIISNGFYVHINSKPMPDSDPVVIPSNADAIVLLSEAINTQAITQCKKGNVSKIDNSNFTDSSPPKPWLPKCDSWHYKVLPPSYNYHLFSTGLEERLGTKDVSEFRIIFEQQFYQKLVETSKDPYLVWSDSGGVLTGFAGTSLICVFELIFYGGIILKVRRRIRKAEREEKRLQSQGLQSNAKNVKKIRRKSRKIAPDSQQNELELDDCQPGPSGIQSIKSATSDLTRQNIQDYAEDSDSSLDSPKFSRPEKSSLENTKIENLKQNTTVTMVTVHSTTEVLDTNRNAIETLTSANSAISPNTVNSANDADTVNNAYNSNKEDILKNELKAKGKEREVEELNACDTLDDFYKSNLQHNIKSATENRARRSVSHIPLLRNQVIDPRNLHNQSHLHTKPIAPINSSNVNATRRHSLSHMPTLKTQILSRLNDSYRNSFDLNQPESSFAEQFMQDYRNLNKPNDLGNTIAEDLGKSSLHHVSHIPVIKPTKVAVHWHPTLEMQDFNTKTFTK